MYSLKPREEVPAHFWQHEPRNFENVTARRKEHLSGFLTIFFFWLLNSISRGILVHKN